MIPKKTKSGKYHVTAYVGKVNGKPHYKSFTAPTKRECILKATEYINHHKELSKDPTIKHVIREYIESKENVLSPSTLLEYWRIYNTDFVPLYDLHISELDNIVLQNFVSNMNVSPKTIQNRYNFLMSVLSNYTDKRYRVRLPQCTEPNRTVVTQNELSLLLDNADPELRKAIILGACSLRRGEVAALKYSDIKEDAIYVHADIVLNQYREYVYKDHAKTPKSTRYVNVSKEIIKALGTGDGYVVDVINPEAITKRFTKLRDKLGINVSFHSLRRFYASISHALGIPDKYTMKQGGWKSENVMRKSYQHTLDKQEQEFQSVLENHLSNTIKIQ